MELALNFDDCGVLMDKNELKEKDRGMAYCGFDCNRCSYEDCVGCKKEGKKLPFCEDGCKIRKEGLEDEKEI